MAPQIRELSELSILVLFGSVLPLRLVLLEKGKTAEASYVVWDKGGRSELRRSYRCVTRGLLADASVPPPCKASSPKRPSLSVLAKVLPEPKLLELPPLRCPSGAFCDFTYGTKGPS